MPGTPTTKFGLPTVADGDFITAYPAVQRQTSTWLDANIATFLNTEPRPAAQYPGRIHIAPSTGVISMDTGSTWVELARAVVTAQPPVGEIAVYAGQALPVDGRWQWCDGGLIAAASFPEFAAAVGNVYNGGVDPGGGQVRKPDLRGRSPLGASSTYPLGSAGGAA